MQRSTPYAHPTSECIAVEGSFYCAVCEAAGHTAADRTCPTLLRKIAQRAQREPERNYRLFVTENPETWGREDGPDNQSGERDWLNEVKKQHDEQWKVVQRGGGRGRLAGGPHGGGGGSQRTWLNKPQPSQGHSIDMPRPRRQGTLERFGYSSRSRTRGDGSREPQSQRQWGDDIGQGLHSNSQ